MEMNTSLVLIERDPRETRPDSSGPLRLSPKRITGAASSGMTGGQDPPLVSFYVLAALEEELGDRVVCRRFVENYVNLWESRYRRLCSAVTTQDVDRALDAVLSLKISSRMVGAVRLHQLACVEEDELRCGNLQQAHSNLAKIGSCGKATVRSLGADYLHRPVVP